MACPWLVSCCLVLAAIAPQRGQQQQAPFLWRKKNRYCEVVYGQRVRDSLWLSDDDIKELDLKKGDGTTIRKAARELQVCGGGPLVPEVQQHQPGKGDETGAVLHELLDKSTPDS